MFNRDGRDEGINGGDAGEKSILTELSTQNQTWFLRGFPITLPDAATIETKDALARFRAHEQIQGAIDNSVLGLEARSNLQFVHAAPLRTCLRQVREISDSRQRS